METIYQTYVRTLCSNCKNKDTNLCEIRRNTNGNLQCCYYVKDKEQKRYKKFQGRTANQRKPIMRL